MEIKKVQLGKTGLMVTKTAMGCLPIQRISHEAAHCHFYQKRRNRLQNGNRAYRTVFETTADRLYRYFPVP